MVGPGDGAVERGGARLVEDGGPSSTLPTTRLDAQTALEFALEVAGRLDERERRVVLPPHLAPKAVERNSPAPLGLGPELLVVARHVDHRRDVLRLLDGAAPRLVARPPKAPEKLPVGGKSTQLDLAGARPHHGLGEGGQHAFVASKRREERRVIVHHGGEPARMGSVRGPRACPMPPRRRQNGARR